MVSWCLGVCFRGFDRLAFSLCYGKGINMTSVANGLLVYSSACANRFRQWLAALTDFLAVSSANRRFSVVSSANQ